MADKFEDFTQEDYLRWRPLFHVMPKRGWLNDPCAPMYDKATGLCHVFYQYNPKGSEWGNMSWGHCTSPNLVFWTTVSPSAEDAGAPALAPDESYDKDGVFTGCWNPSSKPEEMSVFYTSVGSEIYKGQGHDSNYNLNSESLSMASSTDGGKTWIKSPANPILPGAPDSVSPTGWRDPYVSPWPALSTLLDLPPSQLYGIISGGVDLTGGSTFLYSISTTDSSKWSFLGMLNDPAKKWPKSAWAGEGGPNWEVANFFSLPSPSSNSSASEYLITSVESPTRWSQLRPPTPSLEEYEKRETKRWNGWPTWMSGSLKLNKAGTPEFVEEQVGVLDYGCYYAANSFEDGRSGERVVHAWVLETDIPAKMRAQQGWSGCLALPRVLSRIKYPNVVSTDRPNLALGSIESYRITDTETAGVFDVETLGIAPVKALEVLRDGEGVKLVDMVNVQLGASGKAVDGVGWVTPTGAIGKHWELEAEIEVGDGCEEIGLVVRHTEEFEEYTKIVYLPSQSSIRIDRSHSNLDPTGDINTDPDIGAFSLFHFSDPSAASGVRRETLNLRVFCDNSVLEVFVNGRCAVTSRVYPMRDDAFGLGFCGAGRKEGGAVGVVKKCRVWTGYGNVFRD